MMSTTITSRPRPALGGCQQSVAGVGELAQLEAFDGLLLRSAEAGEQTHPGGRELTGQSDHRAHLLLAAGERLRPALAAAPALPGAEHVDLGVGEPSGVRVVAEHVERVEALAAAQDESDDDPAGGEDEAQDDEADDLGDG